MANSCQCLAFNLENHELTVEVLEVGQLYPLSHAQDVGCSAEAVKHHPKISGIQRRDSAGSLAGSFSKACQGMLNIRPCCNDGAEDHQPKGEQGHRCDGSTEPEHLTICNEYNCKIFENGVHRNRKKLQRFCARVDHTNKEERNWKPWTC